MRLALGLAAIVAVSLWLLPQWAPVEAEAWQPPPNPGLTGVFAPNQALSAIAEIAVGPAPEHVACDAEGRLYTSLEGGAVLRREQDGNWRTIGNTNGRPLGMRADGAGGVWIARCEGFYI